MAYEDDDAGGLMTPQFVALTEIMNVSQAIHFVRRTSIERGFEDITYILVVDHNHTLKGGLNVSQLVTADPSDRITDVMYPEVISVTTDTDQEECARIMERYNLIALPVTDSFRRLVGVVKVEDMIDVVQGRYVPNGWGRSGRETPGTILEVNCEPITLALRQLRYCCHRGLSHNNIPRHYFPNCNFSCVPPSDCWSRRHSWHSNTDPYGPIYGARGGCARKCC